MLSDRTTRRGFLGLSGKMAAVAVGAATVPVICSGTALAADVAELPVVTSPAHPAADIPRVSDADYADGVSREPLNAGVECGIPAGRGR